MEKTLKRLASSSALSYSGFRWRALTAYSPHDLPHNKLAIAVDSHALYAV
jgi:hypothetical protein